MATSSDPSVITSVSTEHRRFEPSDEFRRHALFNAQAYQALRESAAKNPEGYWEDRARELEWFTPWKKALEWNAPFAKWFVGGKLNVSHNCLDRHLASRGNKAAIIFEGE